MCKENCKFFEIHFTGKLLELEKKALKNLYCEENKNSKKDKKDLTIIEK